MSESPADIHESELTPQEFTLPASYAQQRMWFLQQLEGGVAYNVPVVTRLRGQLDVDALERAFAQVVERHEGLRTTLTLQDGVPVQRIHPPAPLTLPVTDLRGQENAEQRALALAEEDARRSFDLERGPLVRARVIRIADHDQILILTLHHAIADAWSMGIVGRELRALYAAELSGQSLVLPELQIQYADYAVWQQQWFDGGGLEQQLRYWTTKLAGAPSLLELPTDRPRPAIQTFNGDTLRRIMPAELLRGARAVGEQQGATLFMTLLAAVTAMLSRYSGQEDIVVGTPVAGRGRVEFEGVVGLFVNTLALRVDLADDPSFATLVGRVRETALEAFAHQDLPFEKLVGELAPERSRSHQPVAQVMFVMQSAVEQVGRFEGLEQERLLTERATAKFDLSVFVGETADGGLRVAIEYSADLFDAATIERMLDHLQTLLAAAVAAPDLPLSSLALMDEAERELVTETFGRGPASPATKLVHELVSEQAVRNPDYPAVQLGDQTLSYGALEARSNQLARLLMQRGVGRDSVVAICAGRSPHTVAAILAVLKAGAAYAPIDPAYPEDRIAYMLSDTAAPVLLTEAELVSRLPAGTAAVIRLDADAELIDAQDPGPLQSASAPEDLAYVLYTSGSTGRPKGVAMPHGPLANLIAWQTADWAAPAAARTLQFASLSFDVAFQEIFSTWASGGTLVLIGDEVRRDAGALLALLQAQRVERLFMPYVALQNLCEADALAPVGELALRDVITAGEQLKATPAIRAFFSRHDGVTLHNHYGPTESHVVTAHRLSGPAQEWPELPPIGRPISGAEVRLLDSHGQLVPVGVPGELCIGGVSLARGYLGKPELTAERFQELDGARLYHTGDLARFRADGTIEYLGRIDHQVKVRGYRVEPGEIEAVLRSEPGISDALVLVRADGTGERRLVAYVLTPQDGPSAAELHERLGRVLPEFMVPAAFVRLQAFPLTPNGKVDRAALPAPDDGDRPVEAFVAPRTPLEQTLAEIFQELLGVEQAGVEDSFFALGGHSLLAVRLVSWIRDRLDLELPLAAVFDAPTIAALAQLLDAQQRDTMPVRPPIAVAPRPSGGPSSSDEILPASSAQRRLWFLDRLDPGNSAYHVPSTLRFTGDLDVDALDRALTALVARHESLRTTFALSDGEPYQVIHQAPENVLQRTDLEDSDDQQQELRRLIDTIVRTPFDLAAGPLLRANLIRLGEREHVLALVFHHIVTDGWSMGVVNRELNELYRAFAADELPRLPELPIQYGDFAVWQERWIKDGGLDQQLDYWRKQMSGAPPLLEVPTDRPRPPRQSLRGAVVRRTLEPQLLSAVRSLGEVTGSTLFMTLFAAWSALLARYSGQDDIVVATPVANRGHVQLEGLIGFFVNTLPLRVAVDDDVSFRAFQGQVRRTALDAFSRQDLPFEKLVEELSPARNMTHAPVAQVSFVLNTAESGLSFPGLVAERLGGERRTTKYDFGLYAAEAPDGLRLSIEYATDLFDETTIEQMLDHYRNLLEAAVADPDAPVMKLPMLDNSEREALLEVGRSDAAPYPVAALQELFERAVAAGPDAPALSFGQQTVSYGELNARANRLAHHLIALGAGPDTLVALVCEPSVEQIVALLAVLKAGAGYLPLDPDHPADRLAFTLADADARLVVTQPHLRERLPEGAAEVVELEPGVDAFADQPDTNPPLRSVPENLAYVIYTSGSTGQPKGVQIEHRQVARLLSATDSWFGFGSSDTWTLLHSYAFDFSVWEIWGALAYGGRLVISPKATTRTPDALAELIASEGVTVLNATPSLFQAIQPQLLARAERIGRLRTVIFGGEALAPAALAPWYEHFGDGGAQLVNMYGITETTVHVTYRPITAADSSAAISPIGEPIPDLSIYLLDRHGEPVPTGVVGEMYVGGDGVARGYLNRPELNAARFIENPFGPGRLYRSGDAARRLASGELEFRGRLDEQVKVRGYRIELGEIRAAIEAQPGVEEAAVIVVSADGDTRLAAYLVAADHQNPPAVDELRRALEGALPAYMIPAAWTFMESLPLTRNGKLDRKALPDAEFGRAAAAAEFAAPSNEIEQRLAEIWSRVLGIEQIGIDDDFFEIGGHSMLAVALFSELEEEFEIPLPLTVLFRTGTIRKLAAEIRAGGAAAVEPAMVELQGQGQGPALFCVCGIHLYQALANSLAPEQPVYGVFLPVEQEMFNKPDAGGHASGLQSIEAMAAAYLEVIRRQQPQGPYLLLGFCFGGFVAYEMARQLTAGGEEARLVVMVDSVIPGTSQASPVKRQLRRARRLARRLKLRAAKAYRELVLRQPPPPLTEGQRLTRLRDRNYAQAMRHYVPKPHSGDALLFKSTGMSRRADIPDPSFGWSNVMPDMETFLVSGDHGEHLRRSEVEELTQILRPRLERARQG